jgi:STE24 endopeptidase
MKLILLCIFCILSSALPAAQQRSTQSVTTAHNTSKFNLQQATDSLINAIPASIRVKADDYTYGNHWLWFWNFLIALVTGWIFLFGGLSVRIQKIVFKIKKPNRSNLLYIIFFIVCTFILALPLDFYQNFVREHQYGFSNQNFGDWFIDDLLSLLVEVVLAAPFFVLIYAIFRRAKQYWWLWGAGLSVFFIFVVIVIYPVFITPLFNNYVPVKDSALRSRVLTMARANGIHVDEVYVYNESAQTKQYNANVTGIAGTTRIALNDNVLNNCTADQIMAVLGHEMGHYVLHHLYILVLEFGLLIFIGFAVVKWAAEKLLAKYNGRWQAGPVHQVTFLPLLVVLFTAWFFLLTPVSNSLIRNLEIEADMYGLNAARQPDAIASYMVKTADYNKIDPGYLEEMFFFDHPCRKKRIATAMKWKAENLKGY